MDMEGFMPAVMSSRRLCLNGAELELGTPARLTRHFRTDILQVAGSARVPAHVDSL